MRYRINMCYDGAAFCGWQIQPNEPSVQETLEKALGTLLRSRVPVTGAGRTDTGVSASYYVAHFDYDGPVPSSLAAAVNADSPAAAVETACPSVAAVSDILDCNQLRYKLNAILPPTVAILNIAPAATEFHARFDAVMRRYTYYLHRAKNPFVDHCSYFYAYPEVDFDAMNRAAAHLLGTHDYSCFEKSGGDNKTSVCTVFSAHWEPYSPELCVSHESESPVYWRFTIEADRFLRNMVRAIVGTLLEVGRGRRSEEEFATLILPVNEELGAVPEKGPSRRSEAGESVPGHALFLSGIEYP